VTNKSFSPRIIFLFSAALVILLSTFACGGAVATSPASSTAEQPAATDAPNATDVPEVTAVVTETNQVTPEATPETASPIPAIPETRRLILEYPPRIKASAESDFIRLTLEVDEHGNITPTAQVNGNVVTGEVIEIPDLYETHTVTAEARIDMAGMDVQPSGAIYEPMSPGQSVKFFWSVRPQETGLYRGTVWLHLVFVDRLSGEESRMAVSAQIVEIEAVDLFGLSVNVTRTSGVVGSVIGGIVGFPFLEDIIKFLFKKRRKPKKK